MSVPVITDIEVHTPFLAQMLKGLGEVGVDPAGGLTRTLYDAAWTRATDLVESWMRLAGLQTRRDAIGNVFGRLEGTEEPNRTVLTGSHIDTVRNGGGYDGALGIVGGIAALSALKGTLGPPARSLEVVAICEEEGSRLAGQLLGSRAMLGLISSSELETLRDDEGTSLGTLMADLELPADKIPTAHRSDVDCFVELHVEQGPVLHGSATQIGVVTGIAGMRHQLFTVTGQPDHAGAAPMGRRRDALQGAAEMSLVIDEVVRRAGDPMVGTIGEIVARPGSVNTVPGEVTFSLDLRHPADAVRLRLLEEIIGRCRTVASRRGLQLEVAQRWEEPASPMDADLQQLLVDTAAAGGTRWMTLPSGAAHDSQLWAHHLPTAMVFVPSVEGRSHCPVEVTSLDDCVRGATLLARSLYQLAY